MGAAHPDWAPQLQGRRRWQCIAAVPHLCSLLFAWLATFATQRFSAVAARPPPLPGGGSVGRAPAQGVQSCMAPVPTTCSGWLQSSGKQREAGDTDIKLWACSTRRDQWAVCAQYCQYCHTPMPHLLFFWMRQLAGRLCANCVLKDWRPTVRAGVKWPEVAQHPIRVAFGCGPGCCRCACVLVARNGPAGDGSRLVVCTCSYAAPPSVSYCSSWLGSELLLLAAWHGMARWRQSTALEAR